MIDSYNNEDSVPVQSTLSTTPASPCVASTKESFDAFLTHDWGVSDALSRQNHDAVSRINDALKRKGLNTWFDSDRMEGNIVKQMTSGIENSAVIVVFITQRYIDKVDSDNPNDNCQVEFFYARNHKRKTMISLPMEPGCIMPSMWTGPVGATLGTDLYEARFDFDFDANPQNFETNVEKLHQQIVKLMSKL
jgi:hypothetical protein